jgi:hypothetical protein
MSGYTRVAHRGEFFELSLSTPNMNFVLNPRTGESPEQRYHAEAKARFERIFAAKAAFIEEQMASFRHELAGRVAFVAFDGALPHPHRGQRGPCQVSFSVRDAMIDVAVASAPDEALREHMQERLRDRFVVRARLATNDYELTLERGTLDDPLEGAQPALEDTLAEARPDVDALVATLRDELQTTPPILPYDAALPLVLPDSGRSRPCRFELRPELPRGAALILALASGPSNSQWIDLDARLRALQLERIRRRNQPEPPAKRGWFARLFK